MATRAAIARLIAAEPPRWEGVYHHWDGYPSYLGRWLFLTVRETFGGNAAAFLRFALSHRGGWSHIYPAELPQGGYLPECYCHSRGEGASMMLQGCSCHEQGGEASCDPIFIEYVYAIDPARRMMAILESTVGKEEQPRHVLLAAVPLDGPEPDWQALQGFHGPEPGPEQIAPPGRPFLPLGEMAAAGSQQPTP